MRYRTNSKVLVGDEIVKVRELAERYPRGTARWYPKLQRYVKRLKVAIPEVGEVDLFIVWKHQREDGTSPRWPQLWRGVYRR